MARRSLLFATVAGLFLTAPLSAATVIGVPTLGHATMTAGGTTAFTANSIVTFVRTSVAGNDNTSLTGTSNSNLFKYTLNDFQSSYVDMVFTVNTLNEPVAGTEYRVTGTERLSVQGMEWTGLRFWLGFMVNGSFVRSSTVFGDMASNGVGLDFDWPNKDPAPTYGLLPSGQSATIDNSTYPDVLTYSGFDIIGAQSPITGTWTGFQNIFQIDVPTASQFSSSWASQIVNLSSNTYSFVLRMEPMGPGITPISFATPVPEPATASIFGGAALILMRRRYRHR